jgi:hypothetical protein
VSDIKISSQFEQKDENMQDSTGYTPPNTAPQTNVQRIAELITRLTYREMNEMCAAITEENPTLLAEHLDVWAHGGAHGRANP